MKSTRAKKIVQANAEAGVSRTRIAGGCPPSRQDVFLRMTSQQRSFLKQFGERVRALRLSRGWTQQQLAWRASLSAYTVVCVEGGFRDLGIEVASCIAAAFEMPIRELLGSPSKALSKNGMAMARFVEAADPKIALFVVNLIKIVRDACAQSASTAQAEAPRAKTRKRRAAI